MLLSVNGGLRLLCSWDYPVLLDIMLGAHCRYISEILSICCTDINDELLELIALFILLISSNLLKKTFS